MAYINDVIISISRGTLGLNQRSFDPLVMGSGAVASGVISVSSLTDMTDAGYLTTDDEYNMVSAMLAQSPSPEIIKVIRKIASGTYAAALTTLRTIDDAWYSVCINSRTKADLQAVGTWANSNSKFFFGSCSDITALTGRNADREAYLIHTAPEDFPECAWVGKCLPKQPGSTSWKWKVLNGQIASTFTSTQLNTIRTNNGNALQEQAGAIFTNEGIATSGEYIDVIQGQDWVEDQIKIALLGLFIRNDKISLDDVGIAQVEAKVRDVLKRAGDNKIIAQAISEEDLLLSDDKIYMYQVFVPLRSEISDNDRANRTLPDVKFVYYLAGAIHKVRVTGYITA